MSDAPNVRSIFGQAMELDSPDERAAFLDRACGDSPIRGEVEALLSALDKAGQFMAAPAAPPTIDEPTIAERPGVRIGPYKLMEQIGEGGFGLVFVAEQQEPVKRKVALKVIKPGMDSAQIMARFSAERQALALMDHPNIARVLDAGATDTGRPYFVMELVRGIPITEYCDQNHLAPRERLELFVAVCQAVQHAHQKGIIHRDLKPSNVMVTSHDGKPVAKVIDFGVAKAINQQLTERTIYTSFAQMIGTPLYMSPEQAEMSGLDIDTRSDVYSLGVLLYELLTGTTPLQKKQLADAAYDEIRRMIREDEPPKPSTRLSTSESIASIAAQRHTEPAKLSKLVRGDLDWITMKALEKDRTRRYATANGLARDIQRYLSDEPVEACPPSATYRFRKFAKKNRATLATTAAFALLLIAGAGIAIWQAVRATRAEVDARLAQNAEAERAEGEKQAKQKALEAAAQAQKRLAQIEKGVELFAGMLRGINPSEEEKGGEPLYVQLRLKAERAAAELDAEVVGDPQAVARLQTVLGETLRGLGSYAMAVAVLEKARTTRVRELGPDHPDTLETLNNLASAYYAAGKVPVAVRLYEQVRDARVAKLGADHPDTLTTLNDLGAAYFASGNRPEAIRLFEQVRDAQIAKLGPDHPSTLTTMNNLAAAYYQTAGGLNEAIRLFEQVRDARVAKLGADHRSTLTTLNNLALAYHSAGRTPEAIRVFEQVRDAKVAKLGTDHSETVTTVSNLALAYDAAGRAPEAIRLYEQAAAGVAKQNFLHENARQIIPNAVAAYEERRQFDKAEAWQRRWLAHVKEQAGSEHPAYSNELSTLGKLLLKQEKWLDAERTLSVCLAVREKNRPDAWQRFYTQSMLGGALLGQKKYADAELLLLTGYEGMKQREKTIPKHNFLPEAIERLVRLYEAMDKKDQATKWSKELEAVKAAEKK